MEKLTQQDRRAAARSRRAQRRRHHREPPSDPPSLPPPCTAPDPRARTRSSPRTEPEASCSPRNKRTGDNKRRRRRSSIQFHARAVTGPRRLKNENNALLPSSKRRLKPQADVCSPSSDLSGLSFWVQGNSIWAHPLISDPSKSWIKLQLYHYYYYYYFG